MSFMDIKKIFTYGQTLHGAYAATHVAQSLDRWKGLFRNNNHAKKQSNHFNHWFNLLKSFNYNFFKIQLNGK